MGAAALDYIRRRVVRRADMTETQGFWRRRRTSQQRHTTSLESCVRITASVAAVVTAITKMIVVLTKLISR
jgi:hypothetical protein